MGGCDFFLCSSRDRFNFSNQNPYKIAADKEIRKGGFTQQFTLFISECEEYNTSLGHHK